MAKDEINAFLGPGTTYEGKLLFHGAVRIDGTFLGRIDSQGTLIVGQDAKIDGEIVVGSLILSGHFHGKVNAENKVILHKTARLQGSLRTPVLIVEEGAVLDGEIMMSEAENTPPGNISLPCEEPETPL